MIRNRINGEIGRIIGEPDSFGFVPVEWDDAPGAIYWISTRRIEPVEPLPDELKRTGTGGWL